MVYTQRHSGLFIRQPLIPQADLQADNVFPEGQYLKPGISQVLAYPVGASPLGQRLLQLDSQGRQVESLGLAKAVNVVPPRTDTGSVSLPVFVPPEFTVLLFYVRATAVSGTTPSLVAAIQSTDSQGVVSGTAGGVSLAAITTVGASAASISISSAGASSLLGTVCRVSTNVTGTTPSFTWYADIIYK